MNELFKNAAVRHLPTDALYRLRSIEGDSARCWWDGDYTFPISELLHVSSGRMLIDLLRQKERTKTSRELLLECFAWAKIYYAREIRKWLDFSRSPSLTQELRATFLAKARAKARECREFKITVCKETGNG